MQILTINEWSQQINVSEAVTEDYLYHFTKFETIIPIAKSNMLKNTDSNAKSISLTRAKHFEIGTKYYIQPQVRIVLDRKKIKSKYKLKPFAYFRRLKNSDFFSKGYDSLIDRWYKDSKGNGGKIDRVMFEDEQEEQLLTNPLKNLKKYVVKIQFNFDSFKSWLKDNPINESVLGASKQKENGETQTDMQFNQALQIISKLGIVENDTRLP